MKYMMRGPQPARHFALLKEQYNIDSPPHYNHFALIHARQPKSTHGTLKTPPRQHFHPIIVCFE